MANQFQVEVSNASQAEVQSFARIMTRVNRERELKGLPALNDMASYLMELAVEAMAYDSELTMLDEQIDMALLLATPAIKQQVLEFIKTLALK